MEQLRRVWNMPLWLHVLALTFVLSIGFVITLPLGSLTSDEGSSFMQARQLHATGHWLVPSPPLELDPDGLATVPYDGDRGTEGKAFYAKHPLYPLLLGVIYPLGVAGAIILSMVATLLAATVSALIARELGRPERLVLWTVGVLSPLFFYSYVAVAHTLATALAAIAVLCAVKSLASRHWAGLLVGVFVACALAAAFRTEAAFLGLGLGCAFVLAAWSDRNRRDAVVSRLIGCVAAVAGSVTAVVIDVIAKRAILGESLPGPKADWDGTPYVLQRIEGFFTTWFGSADASSITSVGFTVGVVLVTVAAAAARKGDFLASAGMWVAAGLAYAVAVLLGDPTAISGLTLVFPVAWFALLIAVAKSTSSPVARFVSITSGVGALAVLTTQYPNGGGLEWGGRYFQYLLPAATAVLVGPLAAKLSKMSARLRVTTILAMAVSMLLITGSGLVSVQRAHVASNSLAAGIDEEMAKLKSTGPTFVVSSQVVYPQAVWKTVDTRYWLVPDADRIGDTMVRLSDFLTSGTKILIVTSDPRKDVTWFEGTFTELSRSVPSGTGTTLVVMERKRP